MFCNVESLTQFSEDTEEGEMHGKDPERTKAPLITIPLKRKDVDILIDMFRKKKVRVGDNVLLYFVRFHLEIS